MNKTLEQYLRENVEKGAIDHSIRATITSEGNVEFYIHPLNVSGDTLDFMVCNNALVPKDMSIK
jgi:hypothetical protein